MEQTYIYTEQSAFSHWVASLLTVDVFAYSKTTALIRIADGVGGGNGVFKKVKVKSSKKQNDNKV